MLDVGIQLAFASRYVRQHSFDLIAIHGTQRIATEALRDAANFIANARHLAIGDDLERVRTGSPHFCVEHLEHAHHYATASTQYISPSISRNIDVKRVEQIP